MTPVHLPTDCIDAELRRIGRGLDDAQHIHHGWLGDEYGLTVLWHDGFIAWLGFGARASALIAAADTQTWYARCIGEQYPQLAGGRH